jgi:hypothetical protein
MHDSVVTGSSNIGVVATNPTTSGGQVTISRSLLSSNNYGLYVDANYGTNSQWASISDSTVSGNNVGVHVTSNGNDRTARVHLKHNMITTNGVGLEVVDNGLASIDGNYIKQNSLGDVNHIAPSNVDTFKTNAIDAFNGVGQVNPFPLL